MSDFLDELLGPDMPPHGHCYLWNDTLVGLHVGSDILIVLAYYTIPLALVYLVKKRDDLSFNYMFYLFGLFIFACGTTHLMNIYNVWHGAYWLSGYIKAVTAAVSVMTAVLVWPLLPRALAIPSNAVLRSVNEKLQAEVETNIAQRRELESLSSRLEQLVEERTRELEQAKTALEKRVMESELYNAELKQTVAQLQQTQRQLIEAEKMASLGGLVAGVAHEINTPVGVGVTAASTLQTLTASTSKDYQAGALTASGLEQYFGKVQKSSEIILSNLRRAAEQIHSFKQVAVDQSSADIRHFDVKIYLEEILMSLHPMLKKAAAEVDVQCDEGLEVRSYPGGFSQIITNLVGNALVHAYDEGESAQLLIDVQRQDEGIILRVIDNGRGMSQEVLDQIFDPFFTTRRGKGGSGLGMHIVYNTVTRQMGGSIRVYSELGKGSTIEMHIPSLRTPSGVLKA